MKLIRYIKLFNQFTRKVGEDDVPAYSGQAALFTIISFFPFVMFLLTLIQYLPIGEADLYKLVYEVLPTSFNTLVANVVSEIYAKSTSAILSITVITAIWSSSRGFLAIIRGLNSVYGIHETRNYFKLRFMAIFYTIVLAVILLLTLGFLVFGNSIYVWMTSHFPRIGDLMVLFVSGRTLIALLLLTLFFLALFVVIPNRKASISSELPGAVIAACGWMLYSYAYSFYIDHFSNYSNTYGSLTAIVLLMLWLYFCMYILFVGAEINVVWQTLFPNMRTSRSKNDKSEEKKEEEKTDVKPDKKPDKKAD